ncbi:MAG: hypothetical protein K2X27_16810 [Candidatus Obscuribacterales bacterium]|nr:hypothetical protein [Candidatus Obscuribacterales bacterium]
MNQRFNSILMSLLLSTCFHSAMAADKAQESEEETQDEALVLNLPALWKLANKRHAGKEYVLQYLPQGADLKKPAEMLTVTTVMEVPSNLDAKTYILQVKQAMESAKANGIFSWKLIKESPTDCSCEYSLSGHSKIPDQYELMRVIRELL